MKRFLHLYPVTLLCFVFSITAAQEYEIKVKINGLAEKQAHIWDII